MPRSVPNTPGGVGGPDRGGSILALRMRRVLLSLSVLVLAVPGVAAAAPKAPIPVSPASGATTAYLPAIGWKAASGADHYVYQLAADAGFNSPVACSGTSVLETNNTWATFKTAIPNGRYYWHVRAVDSAGKVSPVVGCVELQQGLDR